MEYPHYNPASDFRPLSDDELMELDELLAGLPGENVMTIEAMDGYLSGLLLTPLPLADRPGADWLPLIWGGDGEGNLPFPSGKQKKKALMLILRHLQSIAVQWREHPQAWEPILSVADDGDDEVADAEDWAIGFMFAVGLADAAWEPLFANAESAALLEPMVLLGADEAELDAKDRERIADPDERDALSRALPDNALALYALRR
ncbi:MAG: YecA family protein [Paucibacter sp.]|nr:YecA family protein [Roseateles sp.]